LKPHGALNNMAAEDADYALAIGRAIKTVDKDIVYVAPFGSEMEKAAEQLNLRLAREGFADRQYNEDGTLASRAIAGTVLNDPAAAAEQVLRMVVDGEFPSRTGKPIKADIHTICVHGDEATGVAVARGVRQALEQAGVAVVPLPEMQL
jgi:5-oxoprolinase (ATP-hydrolysing) subunit A